MSLQSGKITATHFVWNQDEVAQNSREAKRFCNMSLHSAQTLRPLLWFQTLIRCNFYSLRDIPFPYSQVLALILFVTNAISYNM